MHPGSGVTVYKSRQMLKFWTLNFKSVKQLVANTSTENQFFVLMSSVDEVDSAPDSLLLFQFSRPQNMISFWKFGTPISHLAFTKVPMPGNRKVELAYLVDVNGSV